jgi:hypothetical protein
MTTLDHAVKEECIRILHEEEEGREGGREEEEEGGREGVGGREKEGEG